MEKLNHHRQKLESLIDELTQLVGKVRYAHAVVRSLEIDSEKPTVSQLQTLNAFGVRYTSLVNREDAEKMIECRCRRIMKSLGIFY